MSLNARINPVLRHSLRELLRRPPLAIALFGVPGLALAGPTGEDVIRGSADITRPDAQRTNITQHTDRAVINWQTFNVDADEFVTFFQPGASSIVLNRVLGGDASYILGHIEANGQVFLLNPHGVFFTHGASLDVQGFLGSTLDMDPDAFMAGDFSLTRNGASPSTAQVINDGTITAGPGGYVVLAGDFTENTGVITANAGTVALVSGNALTLDIEGDGLVNFAVSEATLSEAAGVRNAGSLIADGGRVIMTAKVANDLVATAVNNEGLVRAHSIEERGGEIYLVGYGGDVVNSGTLDADGENADGGGIALYSDRDVTLADGGVQTAAGDANHEGGVIRAIAEEHLDYQRDNTIRATGGVSGGFVEVSGHESIAVRGAPQIGAGGTFYIDPSSISIADGSSLASPGSVGTIYDAYIEARLTGGTDVILAATSSVIANAGTSIISTGTGDLTVGIGTLGGTTASCAMTFCFGTGVTFLPGGAGNIDLANLVLNIGGNLLIDAGNGGTVSTGDLVTTDGNIRIFGGNITTGLIDASAGVNNAGDVGLGNSARGMTNLNAGSINADGDFQAWTFGSVGNGMNIVGNIVTGGTALLWAGGNGSTITPNVTVTGSINAGASVDITANGGSVGGGNIKAGSITANNNVTLTANGQATNTGRIEIGTGASPEVNYDGGDVISTTGNISITATGPSAQDGGVIVAGAISAAAGDVTLVADGGSSGGGHIHLGDYVSGVFTGANATAGGTLTLTANGDQNAVIDAGNLQGADISITANPIHTVEFGRGTVNIGNATATGVGGSGHITIDAFAGSTSNASVTTGILNAAGDITVNATGDTNTSGAVIGGASLDVAGISGAQHATLSVSGVNGTLQLDNITGVSTQLMINTTHGADIGDVNITGDFIVNAAGQMIDFVGGATAGDIMVTAAAINDVFSSTGIIASGNLSLTASNGDITVHDIDAGGSISLTATGNPLGGGNISIGAGQAGLGIAMLASGDSAATDGGNITVASGLLAGGNITLNAIAPAGGNYGGNIKVNGGGIRTTNGSITLFGTAGNISGGNISIIGAGTTGVVATNGITINASANGGSAGIQNGNVTIAGQVRGGTGAVNIRAGTATQGGSGANVIISGLGGSAGLISGANVHVEASAAFGSGTGTDSGQVHLGDITASGNVRIDGIGGTAHTVGDVSANHIDMHFDRQGGGAVNVNLGDLTATGTALFNRDVVVQIHGGGSAGTTANLTVGNVSTANGEAVLTVFEGASGSGAGNLTVGAISAERFARVVARGDVTTGAITINNAAGSANLQIQSHTGSSSAAVGGDITINGNLSVTGRGEALSPQGAFVRLDAGAGTSTITVTGDTSVTATAGAFSFSGTDSANPVTMSGSMGIAGMQVHTRFGTVDLGNVNVSAVGEGFIDVNALHVSVGDIALNVADGSFTRETTVTNCGGATCNLTRTETTTANGRGEVHLGYYGIATDGTLDFGNVTVNAGDARVGAYGFADITGNAITVNATSGNFSQASTGTFSGAAIDYTETGNGGGADVSLQTTPAGSVTLTGALNVNAQGRGQVNIGAADVSLKDVTVTATGGTFTRTGEPAPISQDDGPFSGQDSGGNGPDIDEGTITGGMAQIHIGGVPASSSSSSSSSGHVNANSVTVTGALAASAPGRAEIGVRGNSIAISGTVTASADAAARNGTRDDMFTNSSGDTIHTVSTVASTYGEANVELYGDSAGTVSVGGIVVHGPVANGQVEGGNVNLGNVTMIATGGDVDVVETSTNLTTGETKNFEFDGPALLSGFGMMASGTLNVADVNITAVGAGGAILGGSVINAGNISITVTDGAYSVVEPAMFGPGTTSFTAGNAILGFDGAVANVSGNITISAGQQAHVAGAMNATGDVVITAGTGITRVIPDTVNFLNAVGDDGGGSIPMPAGFDVSATNISITTTAGHLDLTDAVLDADSLLTLDAGGNIANAGATGSISAGGATIKAGGNIDLANTVITVGTGSAPSATGDALLLSLLAIEGLAPTSSNPNLFVSGANVALGDLAFNGDYLFLQANALTLAGTVTTSQTDTLVQLAPLGTTATLSLLDSGAGAGAVDYSNTSHLSRFAGDTIALGTTAHAGNITVAENSTGIDIGATNLFVLTSGTVTGLERVTSSGVVKDLATLIGGGGFEVPQTDEIDVGQDVVQTLHEEYALEDSGGDDEEEEGDEEGEDTDTDATVEEEGDSLIRQDTVDEEMMCS